MILLLTARHGYRSPKIKTSSFFHSNWKHQLSHGGALRKKQLGRGQRPLSTKEPIHVVFKIERLRLRHKSLRAPQSFLLVMMTHTPQAAFKAAKRLWRYRPFSRVVRGWRAYKTARDYIQLNEQEVLGKIRYQKNRLRGLSSADWQILWA